MEFLVGSLALFLVLLVQTASESSGGEVFAGVPYSSKLERGFYVFISCLAAKANFRPLMRRQPHHPMLVIGLSYSYPITLSYY